MIPKLSRFLILLFFLASVGESFGQSNLKYWISGIYASSQIHSGFISNSTYSLLPGPGIGLSIKNSYFNRLHLGLDIGYILLKNVYKHPENNNWELSTPNIEALPNVEINFRLFGKYMRKNTSTPYIKFAPSLNVFQPRLSNISGFDDTFVFFPYSYLSVGWYVGAGYKFLIKNHYLLQLEFFFNNMNTNKASGFGKEDSFVPDRYMGVRIMYSFMKL
ncbi:MAG: hypothetical protein ACK4KT_01975 [Thermaurantimonas sp.]